MHPKLCDFSKHQQIEMQEISVNGFFLEIFQLTSSKNVECVFTEISDLHQQI